MVAIDHQLVGLAVLLQAADAHCQVLEHRLGGAQQILAGIGQAHRAATAMKQGLFQVGFQAADLLADG